MPFIRPLYTNYQLIYTATHLGKRPRLPEEKTMIFDIKKRDDVGIVPYELPINLYGYIVGADVIPLIGEMSEGQKGLGEAVPHIRPH